MDGRDIARENKLTYKVGKEELYANHGNVNLCAFYIIDKVYSKLLGGLTHFCVTPYNRYLRG